ncbi:MAG: hypothetical protein ACFFEF_11550 [Candidatus Thorarchaeota archaeon]
MVDPNELYPVNTFSAIAWALDYYFKKDTKHKRPGVVELTFPSGQHKERLQKKGEHEITVWYTERSIHIRSRCLYDKKCDFNSERIGARDRDKLKELGWEGTDSRAFFKSVTKWLLKLNLDYVTFIRALVTVCDRKVEIPLTTKYGRTFQKFDEYRRNRWPEDAKPDDKPRFLEEVLVRVCFWIQSASEVGALKE